MDAKVKDLSKLPVEGLGGSNNIFTRVYSTSKDAAWHLETHESEKVHAVLNKHGAIEQNYVPLSEAFTKLCPSCLDETTLNTYGANMSSLGSVKVGGLIYISERMRELHDWTSRIDELDSSKLHGALMKAFTPETHQEYLNAQKFIPYWRVLSARLSWFTDKEETLQSSILEVVKRFHALDVRPVTTFYVKAALSSRVPKFPGRPEVTDAYKVFMQEQVEAYLLDESIHLVHVKDMSSPVAKTMKALYEVKGSFLLAMPSAALDYLSVVLPKVIVEHAVIREENPEVVIENVIGLYDPYSSQSPFRTLVGAYQAAVSV